MGDTTEDRKIKRRNRISLACAACKKKKTKCDRGRPCSLCVKNKTEDQCTYDERILNLPADKKRRLIEKHNIQHAATVTGTNVTTGIATGTNLTTKRNDVCVLIPKFELEQLQNKLKRLESESYTHGSTTTTTTTKELPIVYVDADPDVVFNKSIGTYRKVIFSYHDETLPGHIPMENIMADRIEPVDPSLSITSKMRLSEISPSQDHFIVGVNPYNDPEDTINFDDKVIPTNRGSRPTYFSPLSWTYITRNSETLALIRKYASQDNNAKRSGSSGVVPFPMETFKKMMIPSDEKIKSTLNLDGSQVDRFEEKLKATEDGDDENEEYPNQQQKVKQEKQSSPRIDMNKMNMSSFTLGLTILGGRPRDRELNLIEQIKNIMPRRKVIWLLIKRFFSILYPFFPYIDERDFRAQTARLVGVESYLDEPPTVEISKRLDLAHVSLLFVILRLSYLSLFYNRSYHNETILTKSDLSPDEAEKKYLLLNPINIYAIDVARECSHHFHRLGKVSFPILHAAFYLRIYSIFAPEEGDGIEGGDGLSQNNNLISMCYSLGLNRDPDKFPNDLSERTKNLYRKVWHYVVVLEHIHAYTFGAPISIKLEYYDTKRPFYTIENSNLVDVELEKTSHAVFAFGTALVKGPIHDLINIYSSVGKDVKVMDLTTHLNHSEQGVFKIMGKVNDYVNVLESDDSSYHTTKIMKVTILLRLHVFFLVNYCNLFNYYERRNNKLGFFYLKKLMALALDEILPNIFALIARTHELFGEGADLYINPSIIQALVRIFDVALVAIVRTNFSLYNMLGSPDHKTRLKTDVKYKTIFDVSNKFIISMEKSCRICLMAASILSNRYYFAWAVVKSQNYFLKLVTNPQFYKDNSNCELQFYQPSAAEVNEIADMALASLAYMEKRVSKYCDLDIPSLFRKQDSRSESHSRENSAVPFPPASPMPLSTGFRVSNSISQASDLSTSEVNTPASIDSSHGLFFAGFEDLTFDNSAEIDSIWLQMLQLRNNNQVSELNPGNNNVPSQQTGYRAHGKELLNANEGNSSGIAVPVGAGAGGNGSGSGFGGQLSYDNGNMSGNVGSNFGYPMTNQFFDNFSRPRELNDVYLDLFNDLPFDKLFG